MKILAALFFALCLPLAISSCEKKVDRAGGDPSKPEPSPTSTRTSDYPSSTYTSRPTTTETFSIPGNNADSGAGNSIGTPMAGASATPRGTASGTPAGGNSTDTKSWTGNAGSAGNAGGSSTSGTGNTTGSGNTTGTGNTAGSGNTTGSGNTAGSGNTTGPGNTAGSGNTTGMGNAGDAIAPGDPLAGNADTKVATGAIESKKSAPCANMTVFNTGGNGVLVRAEPKPGGAEIDTLVEGAIVPVKGVVNDAYVQITSNGKQGFVHGAFLTCNAQAAAPGSPGNGANPGVDSKTDGNASAVVPDPTPVATPDCTK